MHNVNDIVGRHSFVEDRFVKRSLCVFAPAALLFLLSAVSSSQSTAPYLVQDELLPIVAPFEMPQLQRPDIPQRQFDIRDFGAQEGGLVKNTNAIRSAIENAEKVGGGVVVIPAGKWLTGAIHLDNNIDLRLARGAELIFSQDFNDYLPVVFSRHEDVECYKHSAFIYADGKTNIAITGEGILNGQGKPWWTFKEKNLEATLYNMGMTDVPVKERIFDGSNGNLLRPAFFQPMRCRNILVEGVTFTYGAFWTITPTYCENIIVRNVKIVTEGEYGHVPNGDGVDPSSSKNVLIENCEFDTGDDCIAIKAGRDRDGLRVRIPTENVVVRNCRGLRGHGGIVIGSETSGGVRNIYAVNCQFKGTDRVVRIKTARGRGGVIENMWFKDLSGDDILREAIHLNMLYTGERLPQAPVSETTPRIRGIHLENITITSGKAYAVELLGLPEMPVEDIWFDGIVASGEKGVNMSDVKGIHLKNCNITARISPLIRMMDARSVVLDSITVPRSGEQFLRVEGGSSGDIRIRRTAIRADDQSISFGPQVSVKAVIIEPVQQEVRRRVK
jgi:hypothetical protein